MILKLFIKDRSSGFQVSARNFGKLLHLAKFYGWKPEKIPEEWPSETWDTEIILPFLGPYLLGNVSKADAQTLADALRKVLASEARSLVGEEYAALLVLLKVSQNGAFEVQTHTDSPAS